MTNPMGGVDDDTVRTVVLAHAQLPADARPPGNDEDLWAAGMDSLSNISVMVAVEEAFDIEFPDEMLTRQTFTTVSSIAAAVRAVRMRVGTP